MEFRYIIYFISEASTHSQSPKCACINNFIWIWSTKFFIIVCIIFIRIYVNKEFYWYFYYLLFFWSSLILYTTCLNQCGYNKFYFLLLPAYSNDLIITINPIINFLYNRKRVMKLKKYLIYNLDCRFQVLKRTVLYFHFIA